MEQEIAAVIKKLLDYTTGLISDPVYGYAHAHGYLLEVDTKHRIAQPGTDPQLVKAWQGLESQLKACFDKYIEIPESNEAYARRQEQSMADYYREHSTYHKQQDRLYSSLANHISPGTAHEAQEPVDPVAHLQSIRRTVGEILIEGKRFRPWVVENLISGGAVTLIGGAPKAGKSTMIYSILKAMETGEPWCGLAVEQAPAWVYTEEGARSLSEVLTESGIDATSFHRITQVSDRGTMGWDLLCESIAKDVIQHQEAWAYADPNDETTFPGDSDPRVIIIDTLGAWADLEDFNNYGATGGIFKALKRLRDMTGCSVVVVHHARKTQPGADTGAVASMLGSAAIGANPDTLIALTHGRGEYVRELTIDGRFRGALKEMTISFDPETNRFLAGAHGEDTNQPTDKEEAVLAMFTESMTLGGDPVEFTMKQLMDGRPKGVGVNKVREIVNALLETGHLETNGASKTSPTRAYRLATVEREVAETEPQALV